MEQGFWLFLILSPDHLKNFTPKLCVEIFNTHSNVNKSLENPELTITSLKTEANYGPKPCHTFRKKYRASMWYITLATWIGLGWVPLHRYAWTSTNMHWTDWSAIIMHPLMETGAQLLANRHLHHMLASSKFWLHNESYNRPSSFHPFALGRRGVRIFWLPHTDTFTHTHRLFRVH